jgi:hypothetical protein
MAGMLGKLWDDVAGGSPPDKGMKQLRKLSSGNNARFPDVPTDVAERQSRSPNVAIKKPLRMGMLDVDNHEGSPSSLGSTPPASPSTASPSTFSREKDNVWRSVFHPGQNKVMRHVGSDKFDKAQPNSPSVYDWMYSGDTKSEYR